MTDLQILAAQAEDGYWVGVKRSPYDDDEWLLSLLFKDSGEYCYAVGVRNNHFRLTIAQIMELPPVAELVEMLDRFVRFCEMMEMPDDLRCIAEAKALIAKARGEK